MSRLSSSRLISRISRIPTGIPVNSYIVCFAAALSAGVDQPASSPFLEAISVNRASLEEYGNRRLRATPVPAGSLFETGEAVFRGQSPPFQLTQPLLSMQIPGGSAPPAAAGPLIPRDGTWNAFAPVMPPDPFLPGGQLVNPYGPTPPMRSYGTQGPQPHRLGWQTRLDMGYLPQEGISGVGAMGSLEIFEFDSAFQYTAPTPYGWVFAFTQQFDLRTWEGPGVPNLPGSVFHFGWDFELSTPANGPFSLELGFNPSINSDFESSTSSLAWNWDGRGALIFRLDPYWTMVAGAAYWDRVNDYVIPYAGFIYTDDIWEWRMMFPEARVSVFIGNECGCSKWLYVRGEYHVEAYEIDNSAPPAITADQVEIQDWRVLLGARKDAGWWNWFIEAGWVFGREVDFLRGTPDFDINSGFITRAGLRY